MEEGEGKLTFTHLEAAIYVVGVATVVYHIHYVTAQHNDALSQSRHASRDKMSLLHPRVIITCEHAQGTRREKEARCWVPGDAHNNLWHIEAYYRKISVEVYIY